MINLNLTNGEEVGILCSWSTYGARAFLYLHLAGPPRKDTAGEQSKYFPCKIQQIFSCLDYAALNKGFASSTERSLQYPSCNRFSRINPVKRKKKKEKGDK